MKSPAGSIQKVWTPGSLSGADAVAEAAAARGMSNLYRASGYFKDRERYRSFCALYAVLRLIADRVKTFLAGGEDCSGELCQEFVVVQAWRRVLAAIVGHGEPARQDLEQIAIPQLDRVLTSFGEAARRFPVPGHVWNAFVDSMEHDLKHHRFATCDEVAAYAEGAAVCPTTIYLHLLVAEGPDDAGAFRLPPDVDLVQCGRDFGLFGFTAHCLRDFRQDLATGRNGHLYVAAEDMARHGVTERALFADLMAGTASAELRALVRDLVERAREAAKRGRAGLAPVEPALSPDRAFILKLIVRSYDTILDKIVFHSYNVMTDDHRLTEAEMANVALELGTLL